jgi:hypothetical protein
VEARPLPSKTRSLVFVAVAGVHALVLAVFVGESPTLSLPSPAAASLTAFIVARPASRRPILAGPPHGESSPPIASPEPISLTLPVLTGMRSGGRAIDWNAAAGAAAAAVLRRRKRITFGFPPGGKSAITLGIPSAPSPAHHAGESDRTPDGRDTEWISDRCYIVSDPPPPGEPDFLKHARVSRGGCLPPPEADPGELFKNLPAYKKHHPEE